MTATEILDGAVALRSESVRFDVADISGNTLGTLMVDRDAAPRMTNDTTRPIRRTLDDVAIPPRPLHDTDPAHLYAEDLDPLVMRVLPSWVLSTGDTYPLGVFLWADDSRVLHTWGEPRHSSLVDQTVILDQALEAGVGYPVGTSITAALSAQAEGLGFGGGVHASDIEVTGATLAKPVAWVAGRDTHLTAFDSLCALAGYLPVYFDNTGALVCRSAPSIGSVQPGFTYGADTVVEAGSAVASNDILAAPNRYVVVDSSAIDTPLVGIFDVPDSAPHSFTNIGFRRVRTIDMQGLTDQPAADAAAAAAYASDASTYSWLTFTTPPDPRHDTFDVVEFDGTPYLQLSWVLECRAGGAMTHTCRGAYIDFAASS